MNVERPEGTRALSPSKAEDVTKFHTRHPAFTQLRWVPESPVLDIQNLEASTLDSVESRLQGGRFRQREFFKGQ